MKKSFERDRQFQNEMRHRRQQDTADNWLCWLLAIMALFCALGVFINEVMG